jgi:hypothetical protein
MYGLGGAVGLVVVAALGLVAYVATLDLSGYRGEIRQMAQERLGRELEITGDLSLTWTPGATLKVEGVRLSNADWAVEKDMVTLGSLDVALDLWPLLSGRLHVTSLRLADVVIHLEQGAEGATNWSDMTAALEAGASADEQASGGSADGSSLEADLSDVSIERMSLTWQPGPDQVRETYRIERFSVAAPDDAGLMKLDLNAELAGSPVALSGRIPQLGAFMAADTDLPVELSGTVGDAEVALSTVLLRAVDKDGGADRVEAKQLVFGYGPVKAVGVASVTLTQPRPFLVATLAVEAVDTDDFSGAGAGGDDGSLDAPLPVALLDAVDAEVTMTVASLLTAGLEVERIKAEIVLKDRVLTVSDIAGHMDGGTIGGSVRVDATTANPQVVVAGALADAELGTILEKLSGKNALEATGTVTASLTATGATPRAMLGSLDGKAATIIREGVLRNAYWELIAEDVATSFLPSLTGSERGILNCSVVAFEIRDGIATSSVVLVDSSRVTVAGEGTIDLVQQQIDMRLVPQPKDPSLLSLATPLLVTGPLDDPQVAPDPIAVIKDVGTSVAGGMINPLAVLLPFMSAGSDHDPCPGAIAIAEGRAPAPKPSDGVLSDAKSSVTKTLEEADGAIKGLFNSLRKAVE